MNGLNALKLNRGKFGVNDLRGAHVTMPWKGNTLLGEIVDQRWENGFFVFTVRHFDRSPWPLEPVSTAVEVLERT